MSTSPDHPVDINQATAAELGRSLVRVGLSRAQAIVDTRNAVGPFVSVDQLSSIEGISAGLVDQNRHRLYCTTLTPSVSPTTRSATPVAMKRKSTTMAVGLSGGALSPGKKTRVRGETDCDMEEDDPLPSIGGSPAGPTELSDWLATFQEWTPTERSKALRTLVESCSIEHVKEMLAIIEPQLQRDFISLLPRELSLYILGFLLPFDLCQASKVSRLWRIMSDDHLLWRDKCRLEGIELPAASPQQHGCPWKRAYLREREMDENWRSRPLRSAKLLKGHDDHVITCLQFRGDRIVSGSDDNTLKVWDASSGECLRTLTGHTGGVWSSQVTDSVVISGSTDRTLKIWSLDSGECLYTLYGHTSTVRCMDLSGDLVVSGSRDATLRLWDINTGVCRRVMMGHVAAVRCVQYDGNYIVSGAYDFVVKVWNPLTEECLHTLQGHANRVYSLRFDGEFIVSGSLDTSIRIWRVSTGEWLHTLVGHQSLTSGMEVCGNLLVSGNADSKVKIWDIPSGRCLHTLEEGPNKHQSAVTSLALYNKKFVITSSDDGTVKLWDLRTGLFIRNLVVLESGGSGGVVWRVNVSNTKLVCAAGSRNGTEETKLHVLDFGIHN